MNHLCVGTVFHFHICVPCWHEETFFLFKNESREWSKLFTLDEKEWVSQSLRDSNHILFKLLDNQEWLSNESLVAPSPETHILK